MTSAARSTAKSSMTLKQKADVPPTQTTKCSGSKFSRESSQVTLKGWAKARSFVRGKKFKTKLSFGSRSERFGINTHHPGMWTHDTNKACTKKFTVTKAENLSPAYYNVKRLGEGEADRVKVSKDEWTRQLDMENWSKLPSIINRHLFETRKELRRRMGPGKYDVQDKPKKPESTRQSLNTRAKRFQNAAPRFCTPGPGSYGTGGTKLGKKYFGTKSFLASHVGRRDQVIKSAAPPPTTYSLKSSLDEFLEKATGTRGPYDLFTGRRDAPIKVGHRAIPLSETPGFKYKVSETFVETLHNRGNKIKGRFLKAPQYPARNGVRLSCSELPVPASNAIKPGPADYIAPAPFAGEIPKIQLHLLNKLRVTNPTFGFDRLTEREMTFQRCNPITPGPGRYRTPRLFDGEKKPTGKCAFGGATYKLDHTKHNLYRDRLRAKNVQVASTRFTGVVLGILRALQI